MLSSVIIFSVIQWLHVPQSFFHCFMSGAHHAALLNGKLCPSVILLCPEFKFVCTKFCVELSKVYCHDGIKYLSLVSNNTVVNSST